MFITETNRTERPVSTDEWRRMTRFDSTDIGWIIISIGMAIGAGIVFLPVQVGLIGIWVFLLSSVIGYPAMYLFQRLFINTLASSAECRDYPGIIEGYLGKNWGMLLGLLYFIMLVIWVVAYPTALTNDTASYLQTFGVTETRLSDNPVYGLGLISVLVLIASRSEAFLFRISTLMVVSKLLVVLALGLLMVGMWDLKENIGAFPSPGLLIKNAIITLPFTLTSILFIQSLSPMVISYRARNSSVEVARFKSLRAMNISFTTLFLVVFFYAVSFTFAIGHDEAVKAYEQNISAMAIAAQFIKGDAAKFVTPVGVALNIFALVTAFFGVYLGFKEAVRGLMINILSRFYFRNGMNTKLIDIFIILFTIALTWGAITINVPVLLFTSICSPIFGMVGCLIPAYLVYKVPSLHRYKGGALYIIIATGLLLCVSPFLNFF